MTGATVPNDKLIPTYFSIKKIFDSNLLFPVIFWVFFLAYLSRTLWGDRFKKIIFNKIADLSLFLIVILVSPPLLEIVSWPLCRLTPENSNQKAEAIVVLGGGMDDYSCPTPFSLRRVYTGSKLFLEGNAPLLILSTGLTNKKANQTEAKAMEMIALGLGVPKNKIILEERSYNTITNAKETFTLLNKNRIKSLILVTSAHHLYRATEAFRKNNPGIAIFPYGTEKMKLSRGMIDWGRPGELILILYEYTAIALYEIKGWI